jgi:hypothetical protein
MGFFVDKKLGSQKFDRKKPALAPGEGRFLMSVDDSSSVPPLSVVCENVDRAGLDGECICEQIMCLCTN